MMRHPAQFWIRQVLLLLILFYGSAGCEKRPEASPPPEIRNRVEVLEARPETFQEIIAVSAVAKPGLEYRLSTQISGMLMTQHVNRGESVQKGTLLFEIDPEKFQLRVKERTANLAGATARLKFMGKERKRKEPLRKDGTLSGTAWDQLQFDLALARAETDQARVALKQAERELRLTVLHSPISGIVLERYHDPGEVIPEGTVLAWIVDPTETIFEVGVSDLELRHLHLGDPVNITVDALPKKTFKGHITQISGNARPETGTFPVEVTVANRRLEILPGMIGRLNLSGEKHLNRILVPLMSIHQKPEGKVVYLAEGGRALKKPVRLGKVLGDRVVIQEGIEAGSRIILMSQRRLETGKPVEITK
ncbi:efflux RND transporter periplasmic adaptor subunit [bacterium AH-315-L15]|nr:efflux RND transporter periplasmic adaptor subunit [bacterium AH-315-L15]